MKDCGLIAPNEVKSGAAPGIEAAPQVTIQTGEPPVDDEQADSLSQSFHN